MQTIFIGGASGIGASCIAIQLAGQWIVVDAGVRADRKADPYPHVSENALTDAVNRLLSEGVRITENPSVYQHMKTVRVSLTGEMSVEAKEELERRFAEETGWGLEVEEYPIQS